MEKTHPINNVIGITMDKIRDMVDVNTVVGNPIKTGEVTIIPVSKVSLGFGSGGSDFTTKRQPLDRDNAFGGGAAVGVNIDPVGFLVINGDSVRLIPVIPNYDGPIDKVIDLLPDLINKVSEFLDNRKSNKNKDKDKDSGNGAETSAVDEPIDISDIENLIK